MIKTSKGKIICFNKKINKNDRLISTPGIWINGKTHWLKNSHEKFLVDEGISVHVKQEPLHSKVHYYDIYVTNHDKKDVKCKLLMMHHHNNLMKEHLSFVSPVERVIYHLTDQMLYLVNGRHNNQGITNCTIQPQWNMFNDKYWDSQEKGTLKYQPMVKGSAVSLYSFDVHLSGRETKKSSSWIIAGERKTELDELNTCIIKTY